MKKIFFLCLIIFSGIYGQNEIVQSTKGFFGYVGDIPIAPLGGMGGVLKSETIGYYFSIRLDTDKPTDKEYMSTMNYNEAKFTFKDSERGEIWRDIGVSVGLTKIIYKSVVLFGGLSYYERTHYVKFFDKLYILGDSGNYVVDGPKKSESSIGLNVGVMIFFTMQEQNSWYLMLGSNINPTAFQLGIGYSLNWF